MSVECRAKDKTKCRYHNQSGSSINFFTGTFAHEPEKTYPRNYSESKIFRMMISKSQEAAIRAYCDQDYSSINSYLHGETDYLSDEDDNTIKLLDQALDLAVEPKEPRQLFRATKTKKLFSSPEEAKAFFLKEFPIGKEIEFKGYSSATESPHALNDFISPSYDSVVQQGIISGRTFKLSREEYNQNIEADLGLSSIIYEFSSKKGAPLSDFGQTYAKKEQEVLLPRGTKFKVIEVIPTVILNFTNELPYGNRNEIRQTTVIRLEEA